VNDIQVVETGWVQVCCFGDVKAACRNLFFVVVGFGDWEYNIWNSEGMEFLICSNMEQ
jgi:hypothetical protein